MLFPVVMHGCESWKKAESWRIDAFELWCWRRLLRVPWTARGSNQSILKEISPEYSLQGLMLKLKLQPLVTGCEELTHWKRPWCCERLKAGGEGDNRGLDRWMASLTQWAWVWVNSGSWWRTGKPVMLRSMGGELSHRCETWWCLTHDQRVPPLCPVSERALWMNTWRHGDCSLPSLHLSNSCQASLGRGGRGHHKHSLSSQWKTAEMSRGHLCTQASMENAVSPLHMKELHSESTSLSPVCL